MEESTSLVIGTAWAVLVVVGRWLLFRKAGRPGWHSLIPIVNVCEEYAICWKGGKAILSALLVGIAAGCVAAQGDAVLMGIAAIAVLWVIIIHWKESMKLAASFGKGAGYGLFLFLFARLGRVVLGLSAAEYVGKSRR